MYIVSPRDRRKPRPNNQADIDHESTRLKRLDRERREFIREAALGLQRITFIQDDSGNVEQLFTPAGCWKRARELWDARPEDC